MKLQPRGVILRDGTEALLRSPQAADATELLRYLRTTSAETDNMARYPDEITSDEETERGLIGVWLDEPRGFELSAFVGGELAGSSGVHPVSDREKLCHRAEFGISVYRKFWGRGIGSALTRRCIEEARALGYEQLELDVVASNTRAAAMYERFGFTRCGFVPHAHKLRSGGYADYIFMVCRL